MRILNSCNNVFVLPCGWFWNEVIFSPCSYRIVLSSPTYFIFIVRLVRGSFKPNDLPSYNALASHINLHKISPTHLRRFSFLSLLVKHVSRWGFIFDSAIFWPHTGHLTKGHKKNNIFTWIRWILNARTILTTINEAIYTKPQSHMIHLYESKRRYRHRTTKRVPLQAM